MSGKAAIFDFDSSAFTVYAGGRKLLSVPAAAVIKRSVKPSLVSYGKEALERRERIGDDELFVRPVKDGAVAHRDGAILLIEKCLRLAGISDNLCVLTACSLNDEQRRETEKVFAEAGVTDFFLAEKLLGLLPSLNGYSARAGMFLGDSLSEAGIFGEEGLISGCSVDIGPAAVRERLRDRIRKDYNLEITDETAEYAAERCATLYRNDFTRADVVGSDSITGRAKELSFTADDLHDETEYVYSRIVKVLPAMLTSAPKEVVDSVLRNGIVVCGSGVIEGFREFLYETSRIKCVVISENELYDGVEKLISDPDWTSNYLGLTGN